MRAERREDEEGREMEAEIWDDRDKREGKHENEYTEETAETKGAKTRTEAVKTRRRTYSFIRPFAFLKDNDRLQ